MRECPVCKNVFPTNARTLPFNNGIARIHCLKCDLIYFESACYPAPSYDWKYNRLFIRPGDTRKAQFFANNINNLLFEKFEDPRILEIGPGTGLTTELLIKQGFDVHVCEMDPRTAKYISKMHTCNSHIGRFETIEIKKQFDLIYAGHVIEHSENPIRFFEKAFSLLKHNGIFYIDTPDTHYAKMHGQSWRHFNTRNLYEHCSLLGITTVEKLAKLVGFKITDLTSLPEFESMQITMRK